MDGIKEIKRYRGYVSRTFKELKKSIIKRQPNLKMDKGFE